MEGEETLRPRALFSGRSAMGSAVWPMLRWGALLSFCLFITYYVIFQKWLSLSIILIILAAASFFCTTWKWYLWPKLLSPLRKLPGPDDGHWILGQLFNVTSKDPGVTMLQWMRTIPNQGIIRYLGIFNQERLLLTSPEALADVFVVHQDDFRKPTLMQASIIRILGKNAIFLAEGSEHRHQRRLLEPAFTFRHIKNLYPIFWHKARESVEAMASHLSLSLNSGLSTFPTSRRDEREQSDRNSTKPHSILDVDDWAFRVALDIVGAAGLGRDFGSIRDPQVPLAKVTNEVYKPRGQALILDLLYLVLPGWFVNLIPATRNIVFARAGRIIKETCDDIVREKRARLVGKDALSLNQNLDCDITSTLLRNTGLDDEAIANQMMTFLAGGQEAPAGAITWAVYLLCLHPEIQSRLRDEVRANLPSPSDQEQSIVAADIDNLPYLAAVCAEVLRFMSPAPITIREAINDTTIAGEFVPKGTNVIVSMWSVNRNEALWGSDAGRFDPTRWLTTVTNPETGQSSVRMSKSGGAGSNYAFMSFLHGRKNCIGQNFAKAELACVVAAWIGRFEFALNNPADATNLAINWGGAIMRPAKGCHVKATVVDGW